MEKPTVKGLVDNLKKLVRGWKTFAIHLPEIEQADIDTIESDRRDDTVDQKQRLYDKWLRVYPEASWEDVFVALEKAGENNIAKSLREKFYTTEAAMSPKQPEGLQELPEISSETCDPVPVADEVVEELDRLHSNFLSLTDAVRRGIKRKATHSPDCLEEFVQRVKDIKPTIEFPSQVKDTNQFFDTIRPHCGFLNPFIVVNLAQKLGGSIAKKAELYSCQIKDFMKLTEIKDLHKKLEPYHEKFGSSKTVVRVEISVQNPMGEQSVLFVNQLIRTLFFLKPSDPLLWLKVVRGCLCVVLLAPVQMKIGLIESSRKKLQFMRLTGIIRLLIDDLPVLAEEEDEHFSFERNLKQAIVDNNSEAVQVLQECVRQSPSKGFSNSEEKIKLDCSNKEEKVEVVKKQSIHLKDDEHLTQESESPDFAKLQEEITGLKRQIHPRDTEFSEREIKLTITIKKHEESIASLTEEIDHLTKEAHCRDIELLAKDNEMTSTITMLEDSSKDLVKEKEQLERQLHLRNSEFSRIEAELHESIKRKEELNNTLMKELKDLKSQMQLKDAELLKKETALIEHIKLKEEFIASLAEEIDHLPKEAHCRDIVLLAKDNEMTSTITMLEDSSKDLVKEKERLKRQLHLKHTEFFRIETELHEGIKREEELNNTLMKELKDLKSQMQLKDAELLKKETTLIEHIKSKEEQTSSFSKELTDLKEKIHLKHMDLLKARSEYADNIRKKQEMNTSLTKEVENLQKDMHFKVIVSSKKEAELCEKIKTLEEFNFHLSKDVEELKILLHTKDIELKKSNEEVVCIKEQEACLLKEIQEVRKQLQASLKELEHSQREVELVKKYQGMSHLKETECPWDEPERIKNLEEMTGKPVKKIFGLNHPWGIAVRRNGDILVVENRAHCVTIVNKDGVKVSSFGSKGTKNGQFNHPRGIAISDDGCVLVTDNHRMQKLTLDGVCIKSVESDGSGHQLFEYPTGITTHTTTGQIFVADTYNNCIQVFNNDLIFSHTITLHGDKKFNLPYDIAVDSHGYLYVAECSHDCITKLTTTGEYITSFGSYGLNPSQLFKPCSLTIYNDYVYVCEHGNNRVSVFTVQGNFLHCFGNRGREVGALNNPYAITSDYTGTLYISDTSMDRIIVV